MRIIVGSHSKQNSDAINRAAKKWGINPHQHRLSIKRELAEAMLKDAKVRSGSKYAFLAPYMCAQLGSMTETEIDELLIDLLAETQPNSYDPSPEPHKREVPVRVVSKIDEVMQNNSQYKWKAEKSAPAAYAQDRVLRSVYKNPKVLANKFRQLTKPTGPLNRLQRRRLDKAWRQASYTKLSDSANRTGKELLRRLAYHGYVAEESPADSVMREIHSQKIDEILSLYHPLICRFMLTFAPISVRRMWGHAGRLFDEKPEITEDVLDLFVQCGLFPDKGKNQHRNVL